MDIGCAQFDGLLEKIVDGANDGSATGKITETVNVIVGLDPCRFGALWRGQRVFAKPLRQCGSDLLKGRNGKYDCPAKSEFGGANGSCVAGIGDDQSISATFR